MTYDKQIANSYKSYRPKLHSQILKNAFGNETAHFQEALDVGCGIGHSSIALLPYCESVIGIDTSEAMLAKAMTDEKIIYQHVDSAQFNWENNSFDLITFAGSLFYCKSESLIQECLRVLKNKGTVVVYDFTVDLNPVLLQVGLKVQQSDYDPTINLDDARGLRLEDRQNLRHTIHIAKSNLPYILFSDSNIREQLDLSVSMDSALKAIESLLAKNISEKEIPCSANVYWSRYHYSA